MKLPTFVPFIKCARCTLRTKLDERVIMDHCFRVSHIDFQAVIEIRKAFLGIEGQPIDDEDLWQDQGHHEVSYHIGFTFGGPVAYNVEVLQRSIVDKMKKLHQDDNSPNS